MKTINPVKGNTVKIQTIDHIPLSLVFVEVYETIYKENKDIIQLINMFEKLSIDEWSQVMDQRVQDLGVQKKKGKSKDQTDQVHKDALFEIDRIRKLERF